MSRLEQAAELQKDSQQLLNGPLKHVRAAALAAALVPLASLAAAPAEAQSSLTCSAGICGLVWDDVNGNGIQDAGEPGIPGITVYLYDGTDTVSYETDTLGHYQFFVDEGTYQVSVLLPPDKQPTLTDQGGDDTLDSDGSLQSGYSVVSNVSITLDPFSGNPIDPNVDFGLVPKTVTTQAPGTGTPGYWKNHPEAWPVASITIGGVFYSMDEAIAELKKAGSKDKSYTMFSSLVPAILNGLVGNDGGCVVDEIAAAQAWMAQNPLGSKVAGSSAAWAAGEPIHQHLDAYNNGLLCAPKRQ